MNEQEHAKLRDTLQSLGNSPPGSVLPLVLTALVPVTWLLIRDSASSQAGQLIFAISVSAMLWFMVAIFQVCRACQKLGWKGANYTGLVLGPRPTDSEELFVWLWTLQACYAVGALSAFVVVLALTSS